MPESIKTTSQAKPQDIQMPGGSRATKLIDLYQVVKGQRQAWESYWQSLHDYFFIESADVNRAYYPGTEVTANSLFDSTTLESADTLASGFMNYLTPPTSKWFALKARDKAMQSNKNVARYLDDVTDVINDSLNRSNFYNEIISMYKSSGVYGTACMIEEEDNSDEVRFYNIPLKQVCLVEDGRGRVAEYFIEFEYTAQQARDRWGEQNLATKLKEELALDNTRNQKHTFLLYIAKREVRDVRKSDKENLPVGATWIDVENKIIMEESGYNEFPAFTHRFDKRPFIPWGYSPAMKALPYARMLNAIAKTNLRTMMKHTDPPIAIPQNAFLMPFNANPRAVNYYNKNNMSGSSDIFEFANGGNPQVGMQAVIYYSEQVKRLMYNDVFLAFDSITKQMNNPEIAERINEKMTMLGPAVGRYISEIFNPIVIRTLGILWRRGRLPEPPDEFMQNPEYEIDCVSQLAQAQRRTELNSLLTGLTLVSQMAVQIPEAIDKINPDKVVDEAWTILGGAERVLRDDDEVQSIRESRAKAMQAQQALEQMQQGADVVRTGSEIDKNLAQTQRPGSTL